MEAVLPVCCASLLIAYLLGYALGEKRGAPLLLIAGALASLAVLMVVGHPLIPALTGALIGSGVATALVIGSAKLSWGAQSAPSPASLPLPKNGSTSEAKNEAEVQSEVAKDKRARESSTAEPAEPSSAEPAAPKPAETRTGREDALQEATGTPPAVGVPAEPSAVDLTRPLGTVEKDAAAQLEEEIRRELSEPPAKKRPSVVPRGVFGQNDAPVALTQRMGSDLLWEAATENLDEEIAPSHCPRCGHRCRPEERYCAACSAPVLPWRCKTCGHRNAAEADFCVRCQTPLELLASPLDVRPVDD